MADEQHIISRVEKANDIHILTQQKSKYEWKLWFGVAVLSFIMLLLIGGIIGYVFGCYKTTQNIDEEKQLLKRKMAELEKELKERLIFLISQNGKVHNVGCIYYDKLTENAENCKYCGGFSIGH